MLKNTILLSIAIAAVILCASCSKTSNTSLDRFCSKNENETVLQKIENVENGLEHAVLVSNKEHKLFSISERMKYYDVPGLSIALIKDHEIEWAKSYGVKTKDTEDSVTINTLFQAASLSKPISAIVALKMHDQGLLNLDLNINEQLNTWKLPYNEFAEDTVVTPKQLILHISGMNVPAYPGYQHGEYFPTITEVLEGSNGVNTAPTELIAAPSTQWIYSGAGYSVLQLLMQEKAGMEFQELMHQELFMPLGLKNSTFEQESLQNHRQDIAMAYLENGEMVSSGYHLYPELAAAGLWTTPIEYAQMICELQKSYFNQSNKILSQESTRYTLSKHWLGMGLGFILRNEGDDVALAYSGGNHGYICDAYSYLHKGSGVVIMTNSNNGAPLIEEIYRSISREYNWPNWKPDTITAVSLDQQSKDRIKGVYSGISRDGDPFTFQVSENRGELTYSTQGKGYPLVPVSKSEYIVPEQAWRLNFNKETGEVDSFKFRLGYGRGTAVRIID